MGAVLASVGLRRSFSAPGGDVEVLKGVDLQVEAGQVTAVLGPSGSGKSTLLHLLAGLDRPDAGEIWWGDFPVHKHTPARLAARRAKTVGLVFQNHYLLEDLTLLENVIMPMRIAGAIDQRRAEGLLDKVGLSGRADFLPSKVSGGERQRAAVARALALKPPVLIADEPTGSLDHRRAISVFGMLLKLAVSDDCAVVVVTHDESLLNVATDVGASLTVYRLDEGRLVKESGVLVHA
ncbi:MAG TPA: ATP-binding cassette domain-containing protein [Trueperaceae bacterium]|nr:ATP-binding cassette domain-containing protein [Trueperaceae bacterium]